MSSRGFPGRSSNFFTSFGIVSAKLDLAAPDSPHMLLIWWDAAFSMPASRLRQRGRSVVGPLKVRTLRSSLPPLLRRPSNMSMNRRGPATLGDLPDQGREGWLTGGKLTGEAAAW